MNTACECLGSGLALLRDGAEQTYVACPCTTDSVPVVTSTPATGTVELQEVPC